MNDNYTKASEIEVGGNHYKEKGMQPLDIIAAINLNFFQGNIVKYVARHSKKNGLEDLKKAYHYCQLGKEYDPYNSSDLNPRFRTDEWIRKYSSATLLPESFLYDVMNQEWDKAAGYIKEMAWEEYGEEISL